MKKLSLGIDVSKKILDASFFDGKSHKKNKSSNSEEGVIELHKDICELSYDEIIITMEATGSYHFKVAKMLNKLGYKVSVVNPLVIKRYSEMKMLRAKTDSVDAKVIAEYGYHEEPKYFKPKSREMEQILHLSKAIADLLSMRTDNSNRIEALKQDPDVSREVLRIYESIDRSLTTKIKTIEKRIQTLLNENKSYKRLRKIPGIGIRIAPVIVGTFNEFDYFENAKQVASFIGINPSPFESGTSIKGKGTISRKGNAYIRKLLYMASLSACVHNKPCRDLYERLLSNGKEKKVALIAVANKLVRQMFAIIKYDREYDQNYQSHFFYKSA